MEKYNKIVKLYEEINFIYNELLRLEIEGRKEETEFLELLNILRDKLLEEKELCKIFIVGGKKEWDGLSLILDKCVCGETNHITDRILDYINVHLISEKFRDDENNSQELDKLYLCCLNNLHILYLQFLDMYLDNDKFSLIKEFLLGFKYHTSFVNHGMEKILVNTNFGVSKNNYIDLPLMANEMMIEKNEFYETRYLLISDIVYDSIDRLLEIKDSQYGLYAKKAESIHLQCMLKAALSLFGEDTFGYDFEISSINVTLDSVNDNDNRISIGIIREIFNNNKDNVKVRKLIENSGK